MSKSYIPNLLPRILAPGIATLSRIAHPESGGERHLSRLHSVSTRICILGMAHYPVLESGALRFRTGKLLGAGWAWCLLTLTTPELLAVKRCGGRQRAMIHDPIGWTGVRILGIHIRP